MKPPRIRLKIRGLMAGVAIVGVVLGVMIERQNRFRRLASCHQAECKRLLNLGVILFAGSEDDPVVRRVEWHYPMQLKYERAARSPWLPVAPDPPRPEYLDRPFTPRVPERL